MLNILRELCVKRHIIQLTHLLNFAPYLRFLEFGSFRNEITVIGLIRDENEIIEIIFKLRNKMNK